MPASSGRSAGNCTRRSETICPVGVEEVETTAIVRSGRHLSRFFGSVAFRMSKPRYRSVRPSVILVEPSKGWCVIFRSEITAPPFCARPVWSRPMTCLPSMRAALAMVAATVTEPVPPMPIRCTLKPSESSTLDCGSGSSRSKVGMRPLDFLRAPLSTATAFGVTVRNDGQKPLTQEKSLLQDDWWMRVLRPNSVATGSTLMQLDLTPQSPQPSQTRSLMTVTCGGSSALPRLRARRSSAAHSWSCSSTVVPGVPASTRWASVRRSRCQASVPPGSAGSVSGWSLVTMTFFTPLASRSATIWLTGCAPLSSWPPVIEVCALRSTLKVMLALVDAA